MYKQFGNAYIARFNPPPYCSMKVFHDLGSFLQFRRNIPHTTSIGLVPTMGALHEGHASLVRNSVANNDLTITTIFVNPTQFGPNEDFDKYPRTLGEDAAMLEDLGVDIVLAPDHREVYPAQPQFYFQIRDLDKKLCGASRPDHMNGVVQVVSILFNLTRPANAYFGLKDYQQCLILQRLVRELHFPLKLVPCPIVRESDGLALSSRNRYLSPAEREQALFLSHTMQEIKARKAQFRDVAAMGAFVREKINDYPLVKLDYFEVLDGTNFHELTVPKQEDSPVMFMAAFLGKTRLIDNLPLYEYPQL